MLNVCVQYNTSEYRVDITRQNGTLVKEYWASGNEHCSHSPGCSPLRTMKTFAVRTAKEMMRELGNPAHVMTVERTDETEL